MHRLLLCHFARASALLLSAVAVAAAQDPYGLDYVVPSPAVAAAQVAPEALLPGFFPAPAGGAAVVEAPAVAAGGYGYIQPPPEMAPPSLYYNYYYPAPGSGTLSARLYLAPRPTPLHVGYTYITYQAFAPHEFLYRHAATYYAVHPNNVTITRVRWK